MVTDEKIRELAYAIWEQEGRPEGKDQEHYFRAKKILEEQESTKLVTSGARPAPAMQTPESRRSIRGKRP